MSVQCFSHVGVCTSDLERSRRFYREVLGFVERSTVTVGAEVGQLIEIDSPSFTLRSVFLERDGFRIELMEMVDPGPVGSGERRPFNTCGLTHFAVRVDEIEPVIAQVQALGGTVLDNTRVGDPSIGVELMYVLDPDGVRVELIRLPGDPTQTPGEPIADESA